MRWLQLCALATLSACGSNGMEAKVGGTGTVPGNHGSSDAGAAEPGNHGSSDAAAAEPSNHGSSDAGAADLGSGGDAARVPPSPADAGRPPPDPCIATGSCPTGVWIDVTPPQINLNPSLFQNDNYGMQDVLVDPARASDLYAFTCHQGVWKSTDYGQTWKGPINIGANGSALMAGKQWCGAIANTSSSTPPTLWTCNGNGQTGVWKSTDGAVSWTNYSTLPKSLGMFPQDVYSITIDPYDANHLITGLHEEPGVAESTDGGKTWTNVTANLSPGGISYYPFFIDTGNADTTAQTWIAVAQGTGGMAGTWRTSNRGATWTQVEKNEHPHGACQIYQTNSVVYLPGEYGSKGSGIYRSMDFGLTWTYNKQPGAQESVAWGTPTNLYMMYGFPQTVPSWEGTPEPGTGAWTSMMTPASMNTGPKVIAMTYDGTHYIFIGGMWGAGLWRYIEP